VLTPATERVNETIFEALTTMEDPTIKDETSLPNWNI
jgi:hypothetical protein